MKTLSTILAALALVVWIAGAAEESPRVSPAIAHVVKLHESGVNEDVMLAYAKGTEVPKPTAEEIIYLNEKGVSKDVMIALLNKTPVPAPATNGSGRILAKPVYEQAHRDLPPAVEQTPPVTETVVQVQQPAPAATYVTPPPVYYAPLYYDPWPRFSIGFGFGHWWGHGHHHHWGHHGHHWGSHGGGGHHGRGGGHHGGGGRGTIGGAIRR